MKKGIISVILAISIIACLFSGLNFSASAELKNGFYYQIVNKEAQITGGNNLSGKVTIPSKIDGFPVVKINDRAFDNWYKDYNKITSVVIPSSVKEIGEHAFNACNIKSITIPNGVKSIGEYAFCYCGKLTSVVLPKSVTKIGTCVFWGSGLTSLTVASGNTKYHSSGNCLIETKSKTVISGCLKSVIPEDGSVKIIGEGAFSGYRGKKIIIPDSVTTIDYMAFSWCANLTEVKIGKNVKSIDMYAFGNCPSLTSIVLPDGLTALSDSTFADCESLKKITIPEKVKTIGYDVFCNCTSLKTVTIPKSVVSIGEGTFDNCPSITDIYYGGSKKEWNKIYNNKVGPLTKATIHYNAVTHTHKWNSGKVTKKATLSKAGSKICTCTLCGKTQTATIYTPKKFALSTTKYTYNSKVKRPSVTVKDSKGNKLKNKTDYTVSYASGRKNVGKYSVKITFKGNYSGTKTLYFTINPKGTNVSKLTKPKTKQIKVTWKKQVTQTTSYQIQYSTSKTFKSGNKTLTVAKNKTISKTIKNLKSNKTYYVRIRTYKTVGKTKYYSDWSKAKSIKTK